jgi:hypothetical protein
METFHARSSYGGGGRGMREQENKLILQEREREKEKVSCEIEKQSKSDDQCGLHWVWEFQKMKYAAWFLAVVWF